MIPLPEVRELSAKDYFVIVWSRRWIVYVCVLAAVVFFSAYHILVPKKYIASSTIILKSSDLQLMAPTGLPLTKTGGHRQERQDQINLLKSNFLAERVIRRMGLKMSTREVLRYIDIQPLFNTNMIVVSAEGQDPRWTADLANTWVREFIHQDMERTVGTAEYGVTRLEGQISTTLRKLQDSEKQLREYEERYGDVARLYQYREQLEKEQVRIRQELVEQTARYKEKHPRIISLERHLDTLEERLKEIRATAALVKDEMAEYNIIQQQTETLRNIYDELITRSGRLETARGLVVSNINIIDLATVPVVPEELGYKIIFILTVGNLFFALFLCFFLEYIDRSLKAPEEAEHFVKVPFLGGVSTKGIPGEKIRGKGAGKILAREPYSRVADDFRNMEVSLHFCFPDDASSKRILVLSSLPGEGKTFIASNLAIISARSGVPVLLIDADLYRGELSSIYNAEAAKGLSDVLKGELPLEEAITGTSVPSLDILPAGSLSKSPPELLESEKLPKVLASVGEKYRVTIIDSPAVLTAPDAVILGAKCDGAILVISEGVTSLKDITAAKKKIEISRIRIIGSVLNDIPKGVSGSRTRGKGRKYTAAGPVRKLRSLTSKAAPRSGPSADKTRACPGKMWKARGLRALETAKRSTIGIRNSVERSFRSGTARFSRFLKKKDKG